MFKHAVILFFSFFKFQFIGLLLWQSFSGHSRVVMPDKVFREFSCFLFYNGVCILFLSGLARMPSVYDDRKIGPVADLVDASFLSTKVLHSILFPACKANLNKHFFKRALTTQKLCSKRASAINA